MPEQINIRDVELYYHMFSVEIRCNYFDSKYTVCYVCVDGADA